MVDYHDVSCTEIKGSIFNNSGSVILLRSKIPTLVDDCIFIGENVTDDPEGFITFINCKFIDCTGLPDIKRMHRCKVLNK